MHNDTGGDGLMGDVRYGQKICKVPYLSIYSVLDPKYKVARQLLHTQLLINRTLADEYHGTINDDELGSNGWLYPRQTARKWMQFQ